MAASASPTHLVLLAAILFGTTGTSQALGPDALDPTALGAARIVGGGLLLVAVARVADGRWPRLAWSAGVGVAVYQLAFFAAVDRTGVVIGTVVAIGTGPAAAGLLGRLVNGDRLDARWALATVLAVIGVAVLATAPADGAATTIDPLGVALAAVAGVGYAGYAVLAKRAMTAGASPERAIAGAFGAGAVLLAPTLVAFGDATLLGLGGLGLAAYLAVVPTALAYVLFARGLRHLTAGETATLTLAEPLTATLLGALVLGERPGAVGVAGACLVLGGLLVLAAPGRRRTEVPA